jgi:hypothetical protein
MMPLVSRGAALVLGPLFATLLGVLLYLQETEPRGELRSIEGEIVSRTPITTKGSLTGFRICVGNDALTFTYADPDPRVDHVWQVVGGATHALVRYSDGQGRNPVLWGLEANGEVLATPAQLQKARSARYYFYVAGFILSVGIFAFAIVGSFKARKLRMAGAAT